jgi:hypothetical protein
MFILNDVNLSNYGRGKGDKDKVKRKSRGNLLRNTAIGVGGLALAGGLGYMALRGKGKSNMSKSKTVVSDTIDKTFKLSSDSARNKRRIILRDTFAEQGIADPITTMQLANIKIRQNKKLGLLDDANEIKANKKKLAKVIKNVSTQLRTS